MSIYTQIGYLPIIFQVGSGKINYLQDILNSKNLKFNNILLLSGGTHSGEMAKKVTLEHINHHEIVKDNTLEEVQRISELVYTMRYDLILAIGGGKVLDMAKRISQIQRINHISIPTIISNDGLISPISVLQDREGLTHSMSGNMPTGVILDTDILGQAPKKYIQAAAGDILSNMSATNDWYFAASCNQERINDIGFQLSRLAAHSLINFNDIDLCSKHFLKMVIQGQVNSGLAMALAGSSRPCSGSEHLISHAIDYLGFSETTLHGYQVGVLSLFCLYLQGKLNDSHLQYAEKIELKPNLEQIYHLDEDELIEVFKVSREMRPGRVTILDNFTDTELLKKYREFISIT